MTFGSGLHDHDDDDDDDDHDDVDDEHHHESIPGMRQFLVLWLLLHPHSPSALICCLTNQEKLECKVSNCSNQPKTKETIKASVESKGHI